MPDVGDGDAAGRGELAGGTQHAAVVAVACDPDEERAVVLFVTAADVIAHVGQCPLEPFDIDEGLGAGGQSPMPRR